MSTASLVATSSRRRHSGRSDDQFDDDVATVVAVLKETGDVVDVLQLLVDVADG